MFHPAHRNVIRAITERLVPNAELIIDNIIPPDPEKGVAGDDEAAILGKIQWLDARERPSDEAVLAEIEAMRRDDLFAKVKKEAQRRIYAVMPDHQQRNALARSMELLAQNGPDRSQWPTEDQEEIAGLDAKWQQIKAIRQRSNEIEQMTPIPNDVTDDALWEAANV